MTSGTFRTAAAPALSPETTVALDENPLAKDYSAFRVSERLLLTGHSHQAWPDAARQGQLCAWNDASELMDQKWNRAAEQAQQVGRGYARRLQDSTGTYALGPSTHDLVLRFLSALDLRERPRLVTTQGEFHSLRRQLDRLEEAGLAMVRVPASPAAEVAQRLEQAADERTAAVLVSSVFYQDAHLVRGLGDLAASCRQRGIELLVDAYHSINVVPFSVPGLGLDEAFVVGGGYKYCQLGEGNAFLRFPSHREQELRPVITGWFGEMSALEEAKRSAVGEPRVAYGQGPDRFAGATYDPVSHYRATEVWAFFDRRGLTPQVLASLNRYQMGRLIELFDGLDLPPALLARDREVPLEELGGFLALRSPRAGEIHQALASAGVATDVRGEVLRLGPAPYLSDRQLRDAVGILGECAGSLQRPS